MTNSQRRLEDKVAVVTGAASGIGQACAELLRHNGTTVVATDLPESALFKGETPGIDCVAADVTQAADIRDLAAYVADTYGHIELLVNCAGVLELGSIQTTTEEAWLRVIDINLTGTFRVSQALVPLMTPGTSSIVNLSSIAGLVALPSNAAYSASKGGVVMLTKSMAVDLASSGIRVNCVCPYCVDSPMMDHYFRQDPERRTGRAELEKATPLGRFAKTEEVAAAVVFLGSDEAAYITGVALPIDGGFSAL